MESSISEFPDAAAIRHRLRDTRAPADPAQPVIPPDAHRWPGDIVARAAAGLTPAGVLIPLLQRGSDLTVLLTQRSAELKMHAGQVSFPGGRMEANDRDIVHTALRETHEEVGISPAEVDVAGFLEPAPTVTGYSVTPVIGIVSGPVNIIIDPAEVEAAFEVPLAFLLDARNQQDFTREFEGVRWRSCEFFYAERRIWGATATMLVQLRKILLEQ